MTPDEFDDEILGLRPGSHPGDAGVIAGGYVRAEVVVRAFEADEGVTRLVTYSAAEPCPCVGAEVASADPDCPHCGGTGMTSVERRLNVRIPAGVQDCAQLRVAGAGDVPADGSAAAGDLLVNVTVLPKPRDARSVRYLALALLIAAVALLVAYLLFR
jgi:DnaJ-class molecular chaperone